METLISILTDEAPISVRGSFYAASVAGAVAKTEAGYKKVQTLLVRMRALLSMRRSSDTSIPHEVDVIEAVEREERDVLYRLAAEAR